ncbi:MAG: DUF4145 domain-containing protein [Dehalococcoidia bacterium]
METKSIRVASWVCGYCGESVASDRGWYAAPEGAAIPNNAKAFIRVCPNCDGPTLFTAHGVRFPGSAPGRAVNHVPEDLAALFYEARQSSAAGAYTATVLLCRKILMHIAVEREAQEGKSFVHYIEHLKNTGYVPPNGEVWVDYIRSRGNEANHEIQVMQEDDALALITFVEMLLRIIYEFPSMVPSNQAVEVK